MQDLCTSFLYLETRAVSFWTICTIHGHPNQNVIFCSERRVYLWKLCNILNNICTKQSRKSSNRMNILMKFTSSLGNDARFDFFQHLILFWLSGVFSVWHLVSSFIYFSHCRRAYLEWSMDDNVIGEVTILPDSDWLVGNSAENTPTKM
jgi:hypothetical protein